MAVQLADEWEYEVRAYKKQHPERKAVTDRLEYLMNRQAVRAGVAGQRFVESSGRCAESVRDPPGATRRVVADVCKGINLWPLTAAFSTVSSWL